MISGIQAAHKFSKKYLSTLKRKSGESYFEHGECIAALLSRLKANPEVLRVALLHDLPLQENGKKLVEESPLSEYEKKMVWEMNRLRKLHANENAHDLDLIIELFTEDKNIVMLRLAHRLADVLRMEHFPKQHQKKMARESLYIYAPLAGKLGFNAWRREIEDRCFKVLHPRIYSSLLDQSEKHKKLDTICLKDTSHFLIEKLNAKGIKCRMEHRIKSLFSSYKKIIVKKYKDLKMLSDRLALRVIVPEKEDCYRALGIIHECMHPIPRKLKDYIGAPKENGYRSIHTLVFPLPGVTEQTIEIQIRTEEMQQESEYGAWAHHDYKNTRYKLSESDIKIELLQNLEPMRAEISSPQDYRKLLKNRLSGKRILVFSPKNKVYYLVENSSVIDYVAVKRPEKIRFLKEILVNGRTVDFDTPVKNGDVIDLKFSRFPQQSEKVLQYAQKTFSQNILSEYLVPSMHS